MFGRLSCTERNFRRVGGVVAPIIDIMFPESSVMPYFIVDNTQLSVPVLFPETVPYYMINGFDQSVFTPGDNFDLLSIQLVLPLSFELYEQKIDAGKRLLSLLVKAIPFPFTAGLEDFIFAPFSYAIPYANTEISINQFYNINDPPFFQNAFKLAISLPPSSEVPAQETDISMINVPDVLNGLSFPAMPVVKVSHNILLGT